jgi:hypothetical protein
MAIDITVNLGNLTIGVNRFYTDLIFRVGWRNCNLTVVVMIFQVLGLKIIHLATRNSGAPATPIFLCTKKF